MIKIHVSIKRRQGNNKEILGKISSIGLHFIEQPDILKGVVRHTDLKSDTFKRLHNRQVVLTPDGLGCIQDYTEKLDENGKIIFPTGVNVRVRSLNKNKVFYNLNHIYVIDIIEAKNGRKYQVRESDYPLLVVDDAPVEFVTDLSHVAELSIANRRRLENMTIFTKKQNGIKILKELIEKGIYEPYKH